MMSFQIHTHMHVYACTHTHISAQWHTHSHRLHAHTPTSVLSGTHTLTDCMHTHPHQCSVAHTLSQTACTHIHTHTHVQWHTHSHMLHPPTNTQHTAFNGTEIIYFHQLHQTTACMQITTCIAHTSSNEATATRTLSTNAIGS